MFSATWPTTIQKLAAEFLSHPVKVTIGSQDLSASHSVTQVSQAEREHSFVCGASLCLTKCCALSTLGCFS